MFTGIITHTGVVAQRTRASLSISAKRELLKRLSRGDSISVDGVCLTVTSRRASSFNADVMPETFARTNLGFLKQGSEVNLELPATPRSFLSGHIVQGHIDGVATLLHVTQKGNSHVFSLSAPASLMKYIIKKGSVAVNGISFTVIGANKNGFTIGVIPHTWEKTTMHELKPGDSVNIEVDILAKYAEMFFKKGKNLTRPFFHSKVLKNFGMKKRKI